MELCKTGYRVCVCIYMGIYRKTFKLERPLDGIMFMKNEPLEAKQA